MRAVTLSRRKLLVLGAGAAVACGAETGPALDPLIDAGNQSSLSVGTLRPIAGKGVAIGRDAGGIYAMSLICTHAGCDISLDGSVSGGSVQCFCHGSVFDGQGIVLRGPAGSPLPHLVVTADDSGELTIHGDQTTSPSTRLPAT